MDKVETSQCLTAVLRTVIQVSSTQLQTTYKGSQCQQSIIEIHFPAGSFSVGEKVHYSMFNGIKHLTDTHLTSLSKFS